MVQSALTIRGLRYAYGAHQVVDGIDLDASVGAVLGVLGPNGAGKSTTISLAVGTRRPDAGTVEIFGHDPVREHVTTSQLAGVMLQDGGLPQSVRAGEYLRHISAMYQDPVPQHELQARLGIGSFAGTPIRRLSGGQRQRVSLAAALAGRPEIVFLDEPSAGLDPQSRAVVFDLIDELRGDGTAVILTTHLLDDAQRLADQVVIVDEGQVRACGSVQELIDGDGRSGALRVELTAAQQQRWAQHPPELVQRPDLQVSAEGARIVISGATRPQELAELSQWLAATGELPLSLSLQPRSLEDVFLELSGRQIR